MNDLRCKLYDGFEEGFYSKNYEIIYGDQKFNFTIGNFKNLLEEFHTEVSEDIVDEIIKTFKVKIKQPVIFEKAYVSNEGLKIYYQIVENVIVFVSFGEFQPGRYMLFYEGIWDRI